MTEVPTSHTINSNGLTLHYVDWGNVGAEPLLLIHGGRDHCRAWDWVAEQLRSTHHVLAMDLRGHGDSDWCPGGAYGPANHIQDIAQIVQRTIGRPAALIAHSMGAVFALAYAGVFPETVTKLVAIEGMPPATYLQDDYVEPPIEDRVRNWLRVRLDLAARTPRRYAGLEEAVARMREDKAHLSETQVRHLVRHGVREAPDGSLSWKFDPAARYGGGPNGLTPDDQHRLWGRISCPVLLVRGADSWFPDPVADGRIGRLGAARQVVIPGAGHWAHHDQLDLVVAEVRRFLAETSAAADPAAAVPRLAQAALGRSG